MRIPINRLETVWPERKSATASAEIEDSWSDTVNAWEENLETLMAEHPKFAIAAAIAMGLVLGWLVKRK